MSAVSKREFEEKCEKIKGKIVPYLEEFYGDTEEWDDVSDDLVKFSVFYSRACDQLFKSSLLWDYNLEPLAKRFLYPDAKAMLDEKRLQRHHYSLLKQYTIDRVTVGLLLNGEIDKIRTQEASHYHYKSLNEYGYTNEMDVINEIDAESSLSIFVPQMIVCKLSDINYSDVIEHIDPAIMSSEKIWMYAWRFLYALFNDNNAALELRWCDVIQEWKACLVKSDFHAFSNAHLILLYYLYCQSVRKSFDIKDLSRSILSFD